MSGQRRSAEVDRRTIVLLGIGGAAALVAGQTPRLLAQERKGVEIKTVTEGPAIISGFGKVRLREFVFEPGGTTGAPRAMENAMVCECSEGSLEVTQAGKTFTANKGHVWTCNKGTMEASTNRGTTRAVMRVFDLLPA